MLLAGPRGLALAGALTAAVFAAALPAQAEVPGTTPSPAGPVIGVIVIFSPAVGTGPAGGPVIPGPMLAPLSPPRGQLPPLPPSLGSSLSPSLPAPQLQQILIAAPTSTGSLVVPVRVPTASGAAPTLTQMQLVIPGPNPSQNTPIALSQLLGQILRSLGTPGATGPGPLVSVFSAPNPVTNP